MLCFVPAVSLFAAAKPLFAPTKPSFAAAKLSFAPTKRKKLCRARDNYLSSGVKDQLCGIRFPYLAAHASLRL